MQVQDDKVPGGSQPSSAQGEEAKTENRRHSEPGKEEKSNGVQHPPVDETPASSKLKLPAVASIDLIDSLPSYRVGSAIPA